jgi:hypothetical protein
MSLRSSIKKIGRQAERGVKKVSRNPMSLIAPGLSIPMDMLGLGGLFEDPAMDDSARRAAEEREAAVRGDLTKIDTAFADPKLGKQLDILASDQRQTGIEDADATAAALGTRLRQTAQDRGIVGSSMATEANEERIGQLLSARIGAAAQAADARRQMGRGLEAKRQDLRQMVAQGRLGSGENTDLLNEQLNTYLSSESLAGDRLLGDLFNVGAGWIGNRPEDEPLFGSWGAKNKKTKSSIGDMT